VSTSSDFSEATRKGDPRLRGIDAPAGKGMFAGACETEEPASPVTPKGTHPEGPDATKRCRGGGTIRRPPRGGSVPAAVRDPDQAPSSRRGV
jgi:hypothetical protein